MKIKIYFLYLKISNNIRIILCISIQSTIDDKGVSNERESLKIAVVRTQLSEKNNCTS